MAARKVLVRDGSAGFSVRRVAQEAGISLGNLQYYFGTRTDLLLGLLQEDIAAYRRLFDGMLATGSHGDAAGGRMERLRIFLRLALGDAQHHEQIAVFRALFSFTEPEIAKGLERYYRELYALMLEMLAHVSERPKDSDSVRRAAALLFPYVEGYETTGQFLQTSLETIVGLLATLSWRILSE